MNSNVKVYWCQIAPTSAVRAKEEFKEDNQGGQSVEHEPLKMDTMSVKKPQSY